MVIAYGTILLYFCPYTLPKIYPTIILIVSTFFKIYYTKFIFFQIKVDVNIISRSTSRLASWYPFSEVRKWHYANFFSQVKQLITVYQNLEKLD